MKSKGACSAMDYEPSSPISLAIPMILSLIPHFDDRNFSSSKSFLIRRKTAQSFALFMIRNIEIEN